MSDRMHPIPFEKLLRIILSEYKAHQSIFSIHKLFCYSQGNTGEIFGRPLEAPFGPAAGPHTQLAQNILCAYLCGARFFELKTVQTLDGEDLPVAKPCILAEDECYNCEWSTELRVEEAFAEYVKAYFAIKLLAKELSLGDPDGFVFNMSIGYDLTGIQSEKIDRFIDGLKDASDSAVFQSCTRAMLAMLSEFERVDREYIESISPNISNSITLSTLHGCPPQEIERIATYLLTQKKLSTYVKCNPTLLGYEFARETLDSLGYGYIGFDDHHFRADLQFDDAVPMFSRLMALAEQEGLEFGVKLTNTFPVQVLRQELPSEEMYMSGRALFPLTIALAEKISRAFSGRLRISYSGGADYHNIVALYRAGIYPVTLATTLLKTGGYERLVQIAEQFDALPQHKKFTGVDVEQVTDLAKAALTDTHYQKPVKPVSIRKLNKKVPLFDCFTAPCTGGCPFGQDIPAYLALVEQENYLQALRVIVEKNPLPFITGNICAQHCTNTCMRGFYEGAIHIRDAKLVAAKLGYQALLGELSPAPSNGKRVAIVGAGPAGIAAAFLLARGGVAVTVFEKEASPGGIVSHVIPKFRIAQQDIERDIALAKVMGVTFQTNTTITSIDGLAKQFDAVILAVGAQKQESVPFADALTANSFLRQYNECPETLRLGKSVAVIGAGNTAMDTARAAKRVEGVQAVNIIYRRTKRYMPADGDEFALAMAEGIEFCELLSPLSFENGVLTCEKMRLGEPDQSGRQTPEGTGQKVVLSADSVIFATGERVDLEFFSQNGIATDRTSAQLNDALMTQRTNVYVIGDAKAGPATVAKAIGDAHVVAKKLLSTEFDRYEKCNDSHDPCSAVRKRGLLYEHPEACQQGRLCLECKTVCESCVTVCPNRANIPILLDATRQILHLDSYCNECGNCAQFCPYQSAPYRDKLTLFSTKEDFENSENDGFFIGEETTVRLNNEVCDCLDERVTALVRTVSTQYSYLL